jgi:hypothetical protein
MKPGQGTLDVDTKPKLNVFKQHSQDGGRRMNDAGAN